MKLDDKLFDEILLRAQESPRRRMNFDLRTQAMEIPGQAGHDVDETGSKGWRDQSQRMLNVLMADTVIPIHRHNDTSETVVVCRGRVREEFYDAEGPLHHRTPHAPDPGTQPQSPTYHCGDVSESQYQPSAHSASSATGPSIPYFRFHLRHARPDRESPSPESSGQNSSSCEATPAPAKVSHQKVYHPVS